MKKIIFCFMAVLLLCALPLTASADGLLLLGNGLLRFGTGSEDSVNSTGNLQQPFYCNTDMSAWRKLTFSSYPLDFEIREGGDGTAWWNTNGSGLYNPVLSGQVIDASGHVSSGDGTMGYGVVVSEGTVIINGKTLEVRNTYEMSQTKAFIKIRTRFTNTGSEAMSNLRYWVGTRDDYVGGTDSPGKEKGNLQGGEFVRISSQAVQARALRITSGTEGVLFYTDTGKADIIIGSSYGWSNIISRDPAASPVSITHDGSYAFYVRLNDLAPGESDEIVWYYAAGSISRLGDIIRDVAEAAGSVTNISYTTAVLNAVSDISGTGHYIVVGRNESAPSAAQIGAGVDYGSAEVITGGSSAVTAGAETIYNISGLEAGTAYDLYFVAKDAEGAYSSIVKNQFSTSAYMPPTVSETAPATLVTGNSAGSGGNISGDGGKPVTSRGIVWGRSSMPTLADNEGMTTDGAGIGEFTSTLSGLASGTLYYIRAYAVNETGASYGPQQTFTTSAAVTFTLAYTAGANGRIDGDANQSINEGGSGTAVTAVPDEGWRFTCWSDGVMTAGRTDSDVTGDISVTAVFALNLYTVTFDSAGGPELSPMTFGFASVLTLPDDPVREGHAFLGWDPAPPVLMPPHDITLTALWSVGQYTITFDSAGGTEVAPVTQDYGTPLTPPEPPLKAGHTFNGWYPAMPGTMPEGGLRLKAGWSAVVFRSDTFEIAGVEGLDEAAGNSLYAGMDTEVVLELEMLTEDAVPSGELDMIKGLLSSGSGGEGTRFFILDISLYRVVRDGGGSEKQEINETENEITVSVIVPEAYRGGAGYRMISVHGGSTGFIPSAYDPETYTLTFETDRFSIYAAAYDVTQEAAVNPTTGDRKEMLVLVMILCFAVAAAAGNRLLKNGCK